MKREHHKHYGVLVKLRSQLQFLSNVGKIPRGPDPTNRAAIRGDLPFSGFLLDTHSGLKIMGLIDHCLGASNLQRFRIPAGLAPVLRFPTPEPSICPQPKQSTLRAGSLSGPYVQHP